MTWIDVTISDDLYAWAEARAAEARLDGVGAYLVMLLQRERDDAARAEPQG